jgi:hypothetical protein
MKDFQNDVARVWEVYGAAWQRNWGFIPMTREEFLLMGKEMKMILKPDLVLIYQKPDDETLRLVRLGSHSELGI